MKTIITLAIATVFTLSAAAAMPSKRQVCKKADNEVVVPERRVSKKSCEDNGDCHFAPKKSERLKVERQKPKADLKRKPDRIGTKKDIKASDANKADNPKK
ncbi:MAG: hypothetical protein J5784_04250 [Muribaculaceae bacterium]|nr:hypothetical protein [Muribaculaceae bacterium]MBR5436314.1 hypothetical protein [Muribaculaceae bacterium]